MSEEQEEYSPSDEELEAVSEEFKDQSQQYVYLALKNETLKRQNVEIEIENLSLSTKILKKKLDRECECRENLRSAIVTHNIAASQIIEEFDDMSDREIYNVVQSIKKSSDNLLDEPLPRMSNPYNDDDEDSDDSGTAQMEFALI